MISLNLPRQAEDLATQGLQIIETHPRALERRAVARMQLGKNDLAEKDLRLSLIHVEEHSLRKKIGELLQTIEQDNQKAREVYRKMVSPDFDEKPEGFK